MRAFHTSLLTTILLAPACQFSSPAERSSETRQARGTAPENDSLEWAYAGASSWYQSCDDGLDNDGDGTVDCDDNDCDPEVPCQPGYTSTNSSCTTAIPLDILNSNYGRTWDAAYYADTVCSGVDTGTNAYTDRVGAFYTWTAPQDGTLSLNTVTDNRFSPFIAVYEGACTGDCIPVTSISCTTGRCGDVPVEAGTLYYVQVYGLDDSFAPDVGVFELQASFSSMEAGDADTDADADADADADTDADSDADADPPTSDPENCSVCWAYAGASSWYQSCDDALDNDGDGTVDCDDADCAPEVVCQAGYTDANSSCSLAAPLDVSSPNFGRTYEASSTFELQCNPSTETNPRDGVGAWYSWTAPADGVLSLSTLTDERFNPFIEVYGGACGATCVPLESGDVAVVNGSTYTIRVYGTEDIEFNTSDVGVFQLNASFAISGRGEPEGAEDEKSSGGGCNTTASRGWMSTWARLGLQRRRN